MYVMTFIPVYKEKIWGGRALERVMNKNLPDTKAYGESWEISAHPNGASIINNGSFKGKPLNQVYEESGPIIAGSEIWNKYKGMFPLLLKFLDVNDKLSIQVHPSDTYAQAVEKSFGKAECWYILAASSDAKLIMGMKHGFTKETYLNAVKAGKFDELFNEVSVKAGDLVTIYPGMVHASLTGSVLLFELQQNSDITYRIYDFDRIENGIKRPLHLDQSADVINFSAHADIKYFPNDGILLDWEYFSLRKITLKDTLVLKSFSTMRFYTVLDGSVMLSSGESLPKGASCLVPAGIETVFEGQAVIMESFPK